MKFSQLLQIGARCIAIVSCCTVALAQSNPRDNAQGSSGEQFRKVGAAGGQFLKIGVGARAQAMGGAFSGLANDLSSLFYNNAGLIDMKGYAANVSYTQWFGGYSHNFLAGSIPVGDKYRVGLSIVSLSSGDIPYTTLDRQDELGITYSVQDFALGGTFSAFLTEQFSFGVTLKYVQNSIASLSSSGLVGDVGTMYRFGGVRVGFSINNLGAQQQYTGQDLNQKSDIVKELQSQQVDVTLVTSPYNLPLSFKAGIAFDMITEFFGDGESQADLNANVAREHRWLLAADFETLSDVSEQFAIGTEYTWNDLLSLRGGYRFGHDQFGLSGGVGIRYTGGGFDGSLDYSIQPTSRIGIVNRLSIGLRLN